MILMRAREGELILLIVAALIFFESHVLMKKAVKIDQADMYLNIIQTGREDPVQKVGSEPMIADPNERRESIKDDGLRPCRVVLENKADYHHEIIESAVHSYPLTTPHLDTKNCSKTKPVIYDFALLNARFGKHLYSSIPGSVINSINDTEFWSWKGYFDRKLKSQILERDDGRLIEYGEFMQYDDYNNRRVDMVIDITCDSGGSPNLLRRWMAASEDRFCINHGQCERCNNVMLNRTCFVSPVMWTEEQCTFFPSKLPLFTNEELSLARTQYAGEDEPSDSVRVCVIGSGRNHSESAALVAALPYEKYHTHFHVSCRNGHDRDRKRKFYENAISKGNNVTFTIEPDYEGYAKWVASCDINLLGVDPKSTPSKFPPSLVGEKSQKKLTGLLPMVAAYQTPTVVHEEFEKLYHGYFRGPVGVYNDTFQSYVEELRKMAKELYKNETKI